MRQMCAVRSNNANSQHGMHTNYCELVCSNTLQHEVYKKQAMADSRHIKRCILEFVSQ